MANFEPEIATAKLVLHDLHVDDVAALDTESNSLQNATISVVVIIGLQVEI